METGYVIENSINLMKTLNSNIAWFNKNLKSGIYEIHGQNVVVYNLLHLYIVPYYVNKFINLDKEYFTYTGESTNPNDFRIRGTNTLNLKFTTEQNYFLDTCIKHFKNNLNKRLKNKKLEMPKFLQTNCFHY